MKKLSFLVADSCENHNQYYTHVDSEIVQVCEVWQLVIFLLHDKFKFILGISGLVIHSAFRVDGQFIFILSVFKDFNKDDLRVKEYLNTISLL